jgi:predicted Zn-dependent protease
MREMPARTLPCLMLLACTGSTGIATSTGPKTATGTTGATGASATSGQKAPDDDMPGGIVTPPDDTPPLNAEPIPTELFSSTISNIVVEVAYQENAEPYVGSAGAIPDLWNIFHDNLDALFSHAPKTYTIDTTIAAMEKLTDVTGTDFTVTDILAIADAHRTQHSAGATATFFVVFLDGYFNDASGRQNAVLGVSIGATAVLAMFKPVIKSTAQLLHPNTPKYVEQATLVHEFGHASGLVDNGLPMKADHRDTAHGRHCSNTECTMYWENEGASGLASFLTDYFDTGSKVLFKAECLADTQL